jgi:hypothetical protein
VETFSADWLALREAADHDARATTLLERAMEALHKAEPGTSTSAVRVIDLGSGSGSNLRYLAPRLAFPQHWHLLDHDESLLATAGQQAFPTVEVTAHRVDLRTLPDGLLGPGGPTLVTGSALLDLVSPAWLEGLADRLRSMDAVALFVLSYDGRIVCDPADPLDAEVRDLVNRHQRTDKGFGPAAGPDATATLAGCLVKNGYTVHVASSDWDLGGESAELQRQLVAGWAGAASHLAPQRAAAISAWQAQRFESIAGGRSRVRVGHQDLLAYPTPPAPSTPGGRSAA